MRALASAINFDAEAAGFNEKTEQDSGLAMTRMPATTKTVAGKYLLERLIGEGGMGAVWRAINIQLEMPVAIKLLRPGFHTLEVEERLRIEARAVAKLVHPGIVRVFDIGESDSQSWSKAGSKKIEKSDTHRSSSSVKLSPRGYLNKAYKTTSPAAKWHGPQLDDMVISRNLPLTPRARHEQVTLVSLVH